MFDIHLGRGRQTLCSGASRRDFLRVGALTAFGLSVPGLLQRQSRAADAPPGSPGAAGTARAKSVLLIYPGGGISHHDPFAPNPDAPETIRGKSKTAPTAVTGLRFGELIPRTAKIMDKVSL